MRSSAPAFIKVCAYFPYPVKVWVNGHEWAKRQAARAGIGFTELSNGFAACDDPAALQEICDRLGPGTIEVFAQRWLPRLPMPFDRRRPRGRVLVGASMRQVEVSRTIVFDAPRRARAFFEALVADNLDIGRPDQVEIIFGRQVRRDTPGVFRTAIDRRHRPGRRRRRASTSSTSTRGSSSTSRTAGRCGSRPSSTHPATWAATPPAQPATNSRPRPVPSTAACWMLNASARAVVLASPAFERIAHPSVDADGRRTPALRFGDPRVMALAGALCATLLAATGITNKSLRALMTGLLGAPYTTGQMTYDLRRLRLNGLIRRIARTNTLRPDPRRDQRVAIFYTKLHNRLLRPLTGRRPAPGTPDAPRQPCAPSTSTSTTTSPAPGSAQPRENLTQTSRS